MKNKKSIVITELALFCYFFILYVVLGKHPKHLNTKSLPSELPRVAQTLPPEFYRPSLTRGWGSALGKSSPIIAMIPSTGIGGADATKSVPAVAHGQTPSQNLSGNQASGFSDVGKVNKSLFVDVVENEALYTQNLPEGVHSFRDISETAELVDIVDSPGRILHNQLAIKTKQPRYTINIRGQALLDAFKDLPVEQQIQFADNVAYAFTLQKRIVTIQYTVFAKTHSAFNRCVLCKNQCEQNLAELKQNPQTKANSRKIQHLEKKIQRIQPVIEGIYEQLNNQGTRIKQAEKKLKERTDYLFAEFRSPSSLPPTPISSPPSSPSLSFVPAQVKSAEVGLMEELLQIPRKSRTDGLKKIFESRKSFLQEHKTRLETKKRDYIKEIVAKGRSAKSLTVEERKTYRVWKQLTAEEKLEFDAKWVKSLTPVQQNKLAAEVKVSNQAYKKRMADRADRLLEVPGNELAKLTADIQLLKQIAKPGVADQVINLYSLEIDPTNTETSLKIRKWGGSSDSKVSNTVRDAALIKENQYRQPDKDGVSPADREGEKVFLELDESQINILREITADLKNVVSPAEPDLAIAAQDAKRSSWAYRFNQSKNGKYLSDVMFVFVRTSDKFRASKNICFRSNYAEKSLAKNQKDILSLGLPVGTGLLECHHYLLNSLGGSNAIYNLCYLTPSEHALLHWTLELERFSLGKAGTSANISAAAGRVTALREALKTSSGESPTGGSQTEESTRESLAEESTRESLAEKSSRESLAGESLTEEFLRRGFPSEDHLLKSFSGSSLGESLTGGALTGDSPKEE
jgi:hypothetical protein